MCYYSIMPNAKDWRNDTHHAFEGIYRLRRWLFNFLECFHKILGLSNKLVYLVEGVLMDKYCQNCGGVCQKLVWKEKQGYYYRARWRLRLKGEKFEIHVLPDEISLPASLLFPSIMPVIKPSLSLNFPTLWTSMLANYGINLLINIHMHTIL